MDSLMREEYLEAPKHVLHKGLDAETGLEIVTAWIEMFRDDLRTSGNPIPLLDSLRIVTNASLLWVTRINENTRIVITDHALSFEVAQKLCCKSGPFHELSAIRFARAYGPQNNILTRIIDAGHPTIHRLLAVPIFAQSQVIGTLALLSKTERSFEKIEEMILSFATILVSMLSFDFNEETCTDLVSRRPDSN